MEIAEIEAKIAATKLVNDQEIGARIPQYREVLEELLKTKRDLEIQIRLGNELCHVKEDWKERAQRAEALVEHQRRVDAKSK